MDSNSTKVNRIDKCWTGKGETQLQHAVKVHLAISGQDPVEGLCGITRSFGELLFTSLFISFMGVLEGSNSEP